MSTSKENIESRLEDALAAINKKHGEGTVQNLGNWIVEPVEVIPTGSMALDVALGVGGLPRGRIIELYGQPSSGKTTIALHAIANAQKAGGRAAFIDAEHALDINYARALGVTPDGLYFCQPESGEQGLDVTVDLIKSGAYAIIVIDSVAALTPRAELEGDVGDSHMGLQARMMGQALRIMTGVTSSTGTTVIFLNQLRSKIGLIYGNPNVTSGGKALAFFASVRMEVSRTGSGKIDGEEVSNKTKVKIVKSKVGSPFKTAEFDIIFGEGIDTLGEIVDLSVEHGFIKKSGAWYTAEYNGDKVQLGQGRVKTIDSLREFPEMAQHFESLVRNKLGI